MLAFARPVISFLIDQLGMMVRCPLARWTERDRRLTTPNNPASKDSIACSSIG